MHRKFTKLRSGTTVSKQAKLSPKSQLAYYRVCLSQANRQPLPSREPMVKGGKLGVADSFVEGW
jgi:hypothetical protein